MLFKVSLFSLVMFTALASAESRPLTTKTQMVNYQPTCDDELAQARRELLQARFGREGFQVIQNLEPVSVNAIEALFNKIAEQISGHGTYDFTAEVNTSGPIAPVLAPVLQYVRLAIDQVSRLGFRDERNLVVDSAEIHVSHVKMTGSFDEAYMVRLRPDEDSILMSITFKGTPRFVRPNGALVPVPANLPFVLSGTKRAAQFPQIPVTDHGEPIRLEDRLEIIVRMHPKKGGAIRFELVQ